MKPVLVRYDVSTWEGFEAFYRAAFRPTYRMAYRLTSGNHSFAEDLVHDAFCRLIRAARSGSTTDVDIGWLVVTVRNLHIDRTRARTRESKRFQEMLGASSPGPSEIASVEHLLADLSDRERLAMTLRYVDDLPVTGVADRLGVSVRATESLLQRAKRKASRKDRHGERR